MKIDKAVQARIDKLETSTKDERFFHVYVVYEGAFEDLDLGGITLYPTPGGPARGKLTASEIETLATLDAIVRIYFSTRKKALLNESVPFVRAPMAWALDTPPVRGQGVAVAVIDSGVDVLHESFQDASGNTRILALWDQTFDYNAAGDPVDEDGDALEDDDIPRDELGNTITRASNRTPQRHATNWHLPPAGGDAVNPDMAGLDHGAEFTEAQINTALTRHRDDGQDIPISLQDDPAAGNHGTHVAGIAAGDGSMPGRCRGGGRYVGVAPEAWLIIVKVGFKGKKMQDIMAAIQYVLNKARSFHIDGAPAAAQNGLPVAVNLSLGSDWGPHNGFSDDSRQIASMLSGSVGQAVIYAAGNARNDAIHAAVTLGPGDDLSIDFDVDGGIKDIDFWFSFPPGADFSYTLTLPGWWSRDTTRSIDITDGANFDEHEHNFDPTVRTREPGDPDAHASLKIKHTEDSSVDSGTWTINLSNAGVDDLHLHIWSGDEEITFEKPDNLPGSEQDSNHPEDWLKATIGVDSSGEDVIAVGAYSIGGSDIEITSFSSQGPAPVGLAGGLYPPGSIQKPDISAPGYDITSAAADAFDCFLCCECCVQNYVTMNGTSQAAPHVAGVVALMLAVDPTLTHTEIKEILQDTTGLTPDLDDGWPPEEELFGSGPLDAEDALQETIDRAGTARVAAATIARAHARVTIPVFQRLTEMLRQWEARFGARPAWHFFAALVGAHFAEVQRLINTQAKVGAIWQRNGGPQLVRSVVMNERDIDPPIPLEVGEKRMDQLIEHLIPILRRFAGERLSADIDRYEDLARALPGRRFDEIDDAIAGFTS